MIKISRYFENPFDDPEISGEELRSFAEDHLGKLKADTARAAMATATQAAFDPLDDALSTRAEQIGALGGGTVSKNDVLQLFRTTIRQREGRVRDAFDKGSPQYREIFPQGLTYYTRATMQNIKQRLDYAVEKFTKYEDELGVPLLTEFTGLRASFNSARDDQVEDKGSVSQARDAVKTSRRTLELQLTDNLLALAKEFKGQPDKAALFFDQSRLEDPTQSQATEAAKPAAPKPA